MDIQLKTGVTVQQLYENKGLTEAQTTSLEKAAQDGKFTEDELQQLEKDGIDTSLIKNNAATDEAADTKKTSVEDKAKEIKEKYCKDLAAADGDKYSTKNPELTALSKALDDGLMAELGKAGYNKNEIVDIINQAFPSVGIKNTDGGKYECPKGHGTEAKEIYNKFVSELTKATSVDPAKMNEAQEKLTKISREITDNNRSLRALEYNITMLQEKIEEKVEEAIEESKDIVEDQKEQAKDIVNKRLNEYTNSNGEMTYSEFQNKVGDDLNDLAGGAGSKLASATAKIISAQRDMNVLNGYITKMGDLIQKNADLTDEAKSVQQEIANIQEQASSAASSDEDCNRCDPIGFTDTDGTRFDLFVDKDSDGNVTNEQEFLGADNGFKEVSEADADGDGKVTADELKDKNVKVVVTNTDGSQEVKDITDVLKEGDSIDLSSYEAQNQELDNGNALLGTFNVTKDGQTLDGYQTLDKLDWLDDNFEFSDEINGTGRHINTEGAIAEAEDYSDKFKAYQQQYEALKTKETTAEEQLGLDSAEIKGGITTASEIDAKQKGTVISNNFKKTQQKEAEKAADEEAKAAAEAEKAAADEAAKKAADEAAKKKAAEEEA